MIGNNLPALAHLEKEGGREGEAKGTWAGERGGEGGEGDSAQERARAREETREREGDHAAAAHEGRAGTSMEDRRLERRGRETGEGSWGRGEER